MKFVCLNVNDVFFNRTNVSFKFPYYVVAQKIKKICVQLLYYTSYSLAVCIGNTTTGILKQYRV